MVLVHLELLDNLGSQCDQLSLVDQPSLAIQFLQHLLYHLVVLLVPEVQGSLGIRLVLHVPVHRLLPVLPVRQVGLVVLGPHADLVVQVHQLDPGVQGILVRQSVLYDLGILEDRVVLLHLVIRLLLCYHVLLMARALQPNTHVSSFGLLPGCQLHLLLSSRVFYRMLPSELWFSPLELVFPVLFCSVVLHTGRH